MIASMPKVLLHVHMETTRRLNRQNNQDLFAQHPHLADDHSSRQFFESFTTLPDEHRAQYSPKLLTALVFQVLTDEIPSNVAYVEFRYHPVRWIRAGLQFSEIFSAVHEGMAQAYQEQGVMGGSIVCVRRGTSPDFVESLLRAVAKLHPSGLVGIDLAGDELEYPDVSMFRDSFKLAKELGLGVTVHAGEFGDADSIWRAIRDLGATRIAHGLSALADSSLIDHMVSKRVMIETSLTSNLWLHAVQSLDHHPLLKLRQLGIPLSINTDNPLLLGTNMNIEFEKAMSRCGLSFFDLEEITNQSIELSFASPDAKRALKSRMCTWWDDSSNVEKAISHRTPK